MTNSINKNARFILSVIFTFAICFFLNAEESVAGVIYYGDTEIYGKEYISVHQDTSSSKVVKKATKTKKKEVSKPVEKEVSVEQEPTSVIFSAFPGSPSSSYSHYDSETATISPQPRLGGNLPAGKACRVDTYPDMKNIDLSLYFPVQRQKLSIAATQCGELTSFGSQSPPA